jgi:hypothetical protein
MQGTHMDVLSLLRSKNRCLEKFLEASTDFLAEALRSEQLPDLPKFESHRDAILKAVALYDRKINEAVSDLKPGGFPRILVQAVEASLKERETLVHRILLIDDQILERVESEKTKILKEIAANQRQAQAAQKFKSAWISESGEEIDERL